MENLLKKVSYLKGLSEGLGVDEATIEGKLLTEIIEVLGEITGIMQETIEEQETLEEYVSLIDQDLFDVEDRVYDYQEEPFDYDDYDAIYNDFDEFIEAEGLKLENKLNSDEDEVDDEIDEDEE